MTKAQSKLESFFAIVRQAQGLAKSDEDGYVLMYCEASSCTWKIVSQYEEVPQCVSALTEGILTVFADGTVGIHSQCS